MGHIILIIGYKIYNCFFFVIKREYQFKSVDLKCIGYVLRTTAEHRLLCVSIDSWDINNTQSLYSLVNNTRLVYDTQNCKGVC